MTSWSTCNQVGEFGSWSQNFALAGAKILNWRNESYRQGEVSRHSPRNPNLHSCVQLPLSFATQALQLSEVKHSSIFSNLFFILVTGFFNVQYRKASPSLLNRWEHDGQAIVWVFSSLVIVGSSNIDLYPHSPRRTFRDRSVQFTTRMSFQSGEKLLNVATFWSPPFVDFGPSSVLFLLLRLFEHHLG